MTIHQLVSRVRSARLYQAVGRITKIMPTYLEACGPDVGLGSLCEIDAPETKLRAEVTRVDSEKITLMPYGTTTGVRLGATVTAVSDGDTLPLPIAPNGHVLDSIGLPLDGSPWLISEDRPLNGVRINPLDRISPSTQLSTGIRAIDGILALGRGQRVGIFAGSGVGKSTLLGAILRHTAIDSCVICLVGERGREVDDFWNHALTESTRAKTTLVVSTSDEPAIARAKAVNVALSIAESMRDDGRDVLFVLDSITRYAMALREVGLASGEPPTARGYTPNVFAALPRIVERCGALKSGGSITGIMSILMESEDADDPVTDAMRSLLDGHIILSRALTERGHFPAIDVTRSASRLMSHVVDKDHQELARNAVAQLSRYEDARTLIQAGLYVPGQDPLLDESIRNYPHLITFLQQDTSTRYGQEDTLVRLKSALAGGAQ